MRFIRTIFTSQLSDKLKVPKMMIRQTIIDKVFANDEVIMLIAKATNRKFRTVQQWLRDNDELLTMASSISVIKEFTGLTESEILTESKVNA
jgi:hypothetical protein